MVSRKIQRMVKELEKIRKDTSPKAQARASELALLIGQKIPKKPLASALKHPPEIGHLIHPKDQSSHPVCL
jgi:hypothetical protein